MSGVPPLSKSIGWTRGMFDGRAAMFDLQRQMATGKKSATYGGLGPDRTLALAMRQRLSGIGSYQSTIQTVSLRLDVMTNALQRFTDIGRDMRGDVLLSSYELVEGDQTSTQVRARNALDESLALLRADVAGRHLFGGRDVESSPVETLSAIMDGAGGRDGFKTHLAERKAADLGGDGRGRLIIDPPVDDVVAIAEDVDGSPFGFKLTALTTTIDGATVTPPGGSPPQAGIGFDGATPEPGDAVRLTLAMPDGTEAVVELKAAAPGQGGPGTFEIGADADETAANFQAALAVSVERTAETKLSSASAYAASEDFFNFDDDNPPRRVDLASGNPPTALRDATPADTVFWYTGDAGTGDPRATAVGKVDDAISVSYGARANEEAFRWQIQNLAVLAAETFDHGDANDPALAAMTAEQKQEHLTELRATEKLRYQEMTARAGLNLSYPNGRQAPEAVHAQIASSQHAISKAGERHKATHNMAVTALESVERADPQEVAVKLLQLQTRLTASYEITAMISRMSLVNYM